MASLFAPPKVECHRMFSVEIHGGVKQQGHHVQLRHKPATVCATPVDQGGLVIPALWPGVTHGDRDANGDALWLRGRRERLLDGVANLLPRALDPLFQCHGRRYPSHEPNTDNVLT
jgi:hypothetical protein